MRLLSGNDQKLKRPFWPKSFLICLNIDTDWTLERIEDLRWFDHPVMYIASESNFIRSVLLLEDKRYYNHSGFDVWCFPRVVKQFIMRRRIGGVSTIEQQLVRTLLQRKERTARRKIYEIILAFILSHRLTKFEILRSYLSIGYFGYRLKGCDSASQLLFGREVDELEIIEAALLASLLVYPLPKVVQEQASIECLYPITSLELYFLRSQTVAPIWTKNVQRRMLYGIALFRKTK